MCRTSTFVCGELCTGACIISTWTCNWERNCGRRTPPCWPPLAQSQSQCVHASYPPHFLRLAPLGPLLVWEIALFAVLGRRVDGRGIDFGEADDAGIIVQRPVRVDLHCRDRRVRLSCKTGVCGACLRMHGEMHRDGELLRWLRVGMTLIRGRPGSSGSVPLGCSWAGGARA